MNPDPGPELNTDWYVDHLLADAERFAALLENADLDASVTACPGWDIARLAEHLGQIHRWANFCARNGRAPGEQEAASLESFDPAGAADWMRAGAAELATTLRVIDPEAPTWHPFPVEPKVAGLWRRRQAQEASVHRWDAEHAAGMPASMEVEVAADGIDEYFGVMLPRMLVREKRSTPPSLKQFVSCRCSTGFRSGDRASILPKASRIDERSVSTVTVA